ncbi:hypothetical protein BDR06DRAFT_737333 [Suillus hirtellus]|nr:hypothetical protein BDR06DRAFT_737333 [Suillus hirtellus]
MVVENRGRGADSEVSVFLSPGVSGPSATLRSSPDFYKVMIDNRIMPMLVIMAYICYIYHSDLFTRSLMNDGTHGHRYSTKNAIAS